MFDDAAVLSSAEQIEKFSVVREQNEKFPFFASFGSAIGIMECGGEASAHAEANALALQIGQRAAPLSHSVRSDGFQHRLGVLVAERPLKLS